MEGNDPVQTFNCYLAAARLGDARARDAVAFRCREGIGVEKDLQRSAYWHKKAAAVGATSATPPY